MVCGIGLAKLQPPDNEMVIIKVKCTAIDSHTPLGDTTGVPTTSQELILN